MERTVKPSRVFTVFNTLGNSLSRTNTVLTDLSIFLTSDSASITDLYFSKTVTFVTPFLTSITGASAVDRFSSFSNLSGLFPPFNAYNINNSVSGGNTASGSFKIISDNSLEIVLPTLENAGYVDIIVVNGAGYNSLYKSVGTVINIYA